MKRFPGKSRPPGLFSCCLAISLFVHIIIFLAYNSAFGPSQAISSDLIVVQDAEVDFQDFPYDEEMKKGSAAHHDNEWVEGLGKGLDAGPADDMPSGNDEKDKQGYFYSAATDSPPVPLIRFDLRRYFPREARLANIREKTVIVQVQVDEYGKLDSAKIVSPPSGYGFDEAAIRIVNRARFRPGRLHGKSVPMVHKLPIRFVLE